MPVATIGSVERDHAGTPAGGASPTPYGVGSHNRSSDPNLADPIMLPYYLVHSIELWYKLSLSDNRPSISTIHSRDCALLMLSQFGFGSYWVPLRTLTDPAVPNSVFLCCFVHSLLLCSRWHRNMNVKNIESPSLLG